MASKKRKKLRKQNSNNAPLSNDSVKNVLFSPATLISVLVIAAATFFVYSGALDNDFVDWDDFTYVINNDLVRSSTDMEPITSRLSNSSLPKPHTSTVANVFRRSVSSNYHPLTVLSMRWNNNVCNDCVYGISARPFIFWNIILHILNTLLVFYLVMCLSRNHLLSSLSVAAIFALHPMHVESVAWVSERKDVLYVFFFLSGLMTYLKFINNKNIFWWIATFILFILSCLSKGMAVVFPMAMLLLYWYTRTKLPSYKSLVGIFMPATILAVAPFFIVSLIFGMLAFNIQSGNNFLGILERTSDIIVAVNEFDAFSLWQRFQFASYGFCQYIIKFFAPHNLSTYYAYPTQVQYDANAFFVVAPFVALSILGLTFVSLKKTKHIFFGIIFFIITVILVLQFVSVGTVIMADRYTYLPYVGIAIAIILAIIEFSPKKYHLPFFCIVGAWMILLSYKTINQIETWQNSDRLWTNVIEMAKTEDGVIQENMAMPFATRGSYYGKMSEYFGRIKQDANGQKEYLSKASEDFTVAKKLNTQDARVYKGLGNVAGIRGEFSEALALFSKAIELDPSDEGSFFNRAVTYANQGQYAEAIADYDQCLALTEGRFVGALINRGLAYKAIGDLTRAKADFLRTLQLEPSNAFAKQQLSLGE